MAKEQYNLGFNMKIEIVHMCEVSISAQYMGTGLTSALLTELMNIEKIQCIMNLSELMLFLSFMSIG